MEILKKSLAVMSLAIICAIPAYSQQEDLTRAFDLSYDHERQGRYSQAVETLKAVYDENLYEVNARLGWIDYLQGNFTESMSYYQKAISLKPYAIEPRLGYVLPAAALGNWQLVEEQYNKILEIDPMNTLVNYRQGMVYYNREMYEKALGYFEKVVNLYPFDFDSVVMMAWTSYKLGRMREAKVLFQKALLIRPNDTDAEEGLKLIQ
jgi:tetratricopeptide (TPR) repeat protein